MLLVVPVVVPLLLMLVLLALLVVFIPVRHVTAKATNAGARGGRGAPVDGDEGRREGVRREARR